MTPVTFIAITLIAFEPIQSTERKPVKSVKADDADGAPQADDSEKAAE